jgi:hypothetical protein
MIATHSKLLGFSENGFQINEKTCFAGIRISEMMSNKADRKERTMDEKPVKRKAAGQFLPEREIRPARHRGGIRWLTVTMLLIWDGVLMYMIVRCLIEPVCGAAFIAVLSIYLGYQL